MQLENRFSRTENLSVFGISNALHRFMRNLLFMTYLLNETVRKERTQTFGDPTNEEKCRENTARKAGIFHYSCTSF